MLTLFTTAKAFLGHDGIIQRNALASWKLLDPNVEVILFGDDSGAAEVCAELGLRHEPSVMRHDSGTKYLNYIFTRAQEIARYEYLCFANCDIVLTEDFCAAFERAKTWRDRFLLVSRRWDTDVTQSIDFERGDWANELREVARTRGFQQDESWIDVFLFRRGQYAGMPPLIVGHCYWDNWMIWKALADGVGVLDASPYVTLIHQNHGYNPKFGRTKGSPNDALSLANLEAAGGAKHLRRIDGATYRMAPSGAIRRTYLRNTYKWRQPFLRMREAWTYSLWLPAWHRVLGLTRPLREVIGLRKKQIPHR